MDVRQKLEVIAHLGDHISYKEDIGICYDNALAKVIEDAYMTLKNGVTVQEYISVKDRLPEVGCNVLFVCENGNYCVGAYSDTYKDFFSGQFPVKGVTHWQYLPQPPKGE